MKIVIQGVGIGVDCCWKGWRSLGERAKKKIDEKRKNEIMLGFQFGVRFTVVHSSFRDFSTPNYMRRPKKKLLEEHCACHQWCPFSQSWGNAPPPHPHGSWDRRWLAANQFDGFSTRSRSPPQMNAALQAGLQGARFMEARARFVGKNWTPPWKRNRFGEKGST